MTENKPNPEDAASGADGGMACGSAGGPGQGNTLQDASDEAVRELENEDEPHAGHGDYG